MRGERGEEERRGGAKRLHEQRIRTTIEYAYSLDKLHPPGLLTSFCSRRRFSHRGNLKYWTTSIAPVVSFDAHDQTSINAVSFAPSDNKFVTCGDDRAVNIFDFETQKLERNLAGHGWDVKTCQWHPGASVVASGGKVRIEKWSAGGGGGERSDLRLISSFRSSPYVFPSPLHSLSPH